MIIYYIGKFPKKKKTATYVVDNKSRKGKKTFPYKTSRAKIRLYFNNSNISNRFFSFKPYTSFLIFHIGYNS